MNTDYDSEFIIATNTRRSLNELETFLNNGKFETPKKSPYTNVIDQRTGRTFAIPFNIAVKEPPDVNKLKSGKKIDNQSVSYFGSYGDNIKSGNMFIDPPISTQSPIEELFMRLEACRLDGISLCFSERQYFTVNRTIASEAVISTEVKPVPVEAQDDLGEIDFTDVSSIDDPGDFMPSDLEPGVVVNFDKSMDIEIERSCIEYDFDIYLKEKRNLPSGTFMGMLSAFTSIANDVMDWGDPNELENPLDPKSGVPIAFYAAVLRKPQRRISDPAEPAFKKYGECWKESFHLRIYFKISKGVKVYLRKRLLADAGFQDLFSGIAMLNSMDEAFDKAIISNPIMLLGSMKRGGSKPHELETLYHVSYRPIQRHPLIQPQDDFKIVTRDPTPILDGAGRKRGLNPATTYCKYNLAYELSLNYEVSGGLIRKHAYEPKEKYRSEIDSYAERVEFDVVTDADLDLYETQVTSITAQDFDARYLRQILDIIGRHRAIDYVSWKTVILAIARRSKDWKPLAIWFSLRYAASFAKDGLAQIDGLWKWAEQHRGSDDPVTVNTLYYWARNDNINEYNRLQETNMFQKIQKIIFQQQGMLNDAQFARILREMFGQKFRCDESGVSLARGMSNIVWREFVNDSDDRKAGELFKWRRQSHLYTLDDYIKFKLPLYLDTVLNFCQNKIEKIVDELKQPNVQNAEEKKGEQKYFEIVKKGLKKTKFQLGNQTQVNRIMEACKTEFIRGNRGFEERMDQNPIYIGVQNGVLKLRPRLQMIQGYHEIPISKSVKVDYVPYDPKDPHIMELEPVLKEIFNNNLETYVFWMCYLASGLDDLPKTPQFFSIWHGSGAQGKSVINEMHLNTLGLGKPGGEGGYATKMDIGWFCSDRKGSGPDSALSATKKMRSIWCSESDIEAAPRVGKIKEISSDHVSGNDKNEKQDVWKVNSHITVPTNNKMRIIGRDYGTWRRILYYRFKRMFKRLDGPIGDRYDPNDPTHSIARQEIIDVWVHDYAYQTAYFSILTHFYEVLRDQYGGDIRRVPKGEVDKETDEYFKEQDTLTQFVGDRVIHIGPEYPDGSEVELIGIAEVMQRYIKWFTATIGANKFNNQELKEQILTHYKLEKYFINGLGGQYLKFHRVLDIGENIAKILKNSEARKNDPTTRDAATIVPVDNIQDPTITYILDLDFGNEEPVPVEDEFGNLETPVVDEKFDDVDFSDLSFE